MVEALIILFCNVEAISDFHVNRLWRLLETKPNWREFESKWEETSGEWRVQVNIFSVIFCYWGFVLGWS